MQNYLHLLTKEGFYLMVLIKHIKIYEYDDDKDQVWLLAWDRAERPEIGG